MTDSPKLSVCMIAHNEEAKIEKALASVQFADEIIVIDCQSTDKTASISTEMGCKVIERPNDPNLNINKNYSFDQAIGEFILSIDADEVIPPELAREIRELIDSQPEESGFFIPRRNYYLGRWLKHGGNYPDKQLRLFKKSDGRFPAKHVHERIHIDGKIGRLKNPMYHFTYETLGECLLKMERYTEFEAKHLFNKGVRPSLHAAFHYLYWKPLQRFLRRYILKLGFLDGRQGWRAIQMDMNNFRLRYRKLQKLANDRSMVAE